MRPRLYTIVETYGRVTTDEWIIMTEGKNKRNRANDIAMISVTPNYNGDESGLWVREQPWAPRMKAVQIRTSVNAYIS